MHEDQSFVVGMGYGGERPLPQSLPENAHMPSLPAMPSTLPPSPPKSIASFHPIDSLLLKSNFPSEIHNSKLKKMKKKKRAKYCMNVPFFFRSNMDNNTYTTATTGEDDGDDDGSTATYGYNDSSSWIEEDYGVTHTNNLYRNPNRGLGNSSHGMKYIVYFFKISYHAELNHRWIFLLYKTGEGTTIHELVLRLRIFHWILCLFGITTQFYTWLGNALTLRPARVILGAYNLFFFLVLLALELHLPWINSFLRKNFGFLFLTSGRCVLLFLMGSLSIGQGSTPLALVGTFCFILAIYTITLLCKFPAVDAAFANEGQDEIYPTSLPKTKVTKYAWSSLTVPEERASLLSSLTKTYI